MCQKTRELNRDDVIVMKALCLVPFLIPLLGQQQLVLLVYLWEEIQ